MIVDEVPDTLKEAVVYSLDLGALLAGTKYQGERLKGLLANLAEATTRFCSSTRSTPSSERVPPQAA